MRELLEEARSDQRVVAIDREVFEDFGELGYVVALGDGLCLLRQISDGMRFNGYTVLRLADISHVEVPHAHEEFVEAALRLRREASEAPPAIDLESMARAVRSAGRLEELVTIHTEEIDSGICKIGRVRTVDEEEIGMIALDPDADWDDEITAIPLSDVTRIDVGGAYEEALLLVGGPCPVPILRPVD